MLAGIQDIAQTGANIHSTILHQCQRSSGTQHFARQHTTISSCRDQKQSLGIIPFRLLVSRCGSRCQTILGHRCLIIFKNIKNSFVPGVLHLLILLSAPVFGNAHAERYVNVIILICRGIT